MGLFIKNKQTAEREIIKILVSDVELNPNQPRKHFDSAELIELAMSIKENGLMQPLSVRVNESGKYELIAGERRLRAAKIAGLEKIEAVICNTSVEESAIMAIIENIQRSDLNCIEEALAIEKLINYYGYTQEQLAKKLGKAQSTIANKLRILKLTDKLKKKVIEYGLCERQIRCLLKLPEEKREKAAEHIYKYNMNVGSTERYIETLISGNKKPPKKIWTFKNKRLYINNINRTLETMKKSGIEFVSEKREENGYLEYIIRIPHD